MNSEVGQAFEKWLTNHNQDNWSPRHYEEWGGYGEDDMRQSYLAGRESANPQYGIGTKIDPRTKPSIEPAMSAISEQGEQWQPIETAPRYEKLFVVRRKDTPHVQHEAMLFRESQTWEMPQEYDCLHNMTTDEPIDDDWDSYEWMPLPTPQQQNATTGEGRE